MNFKADVNNLRVMMDGNFLHSAGIGSEPSAFNEESRGKLRGPSFHFG